MKLRYVILTAFSYVSLAQAHFLEIIPARPSLQQGHSTSLAIDIQFTHPMIGGPVMAIDRPVEVGVVGPGQIHIVNDLLQATENGSYKLTYPVRKPGDYQFYVIPADYWEPAEKKMIRHYAKVIIDAYGVMDGWQTMIGLPVEIQPRIRPYGIWVGNLFQGRVYADGAPLGNTEIEVEWRNDGSVNAVAPAFNTQVLLTDEQGYFSYAIPRAGWWGFAALIDRETAMSPDGNTVPLEEGGLIWIHAMEMK